MINIKKLSLFFNEKITYEGIKNMINMQVLDLFYNENIKDEDIKYIKNLKNYSFIIAL